MPKEQKNQPQDDQLERLNAIREQISTIKETKTRLMGELDGHKKRKEELATECKTKFDVSIEKLPTKIESMRKEIETVLKEAETLLGEK